MRARSPRGPRGPNRGHTSDAQKRANRKYFAERQERMTEARGIQISLSRFAMMKLVPVSG